MKMRKIWGNKKTILKMEGEFGNFNRELMFAILSLFSIPNFYRIILKTIIFPEKYEDLFFFLLFT